MWTGYGMRDMRYRLRFLAALMFLALPALPRRAAAISLTVDGAPAVVGQNVAVTGDGATNPEQLFVIDHTTATTMLSRSRREVIMVADQRYRRHR